MVPFGLTCDYTIYLFICEPLSIIYELQGRAHNTMFALMRKQW